MNADLANKTAIIVGAGRGIGKSVALKFAQLGVNLILASRTFTEVITVTNECIETGIHAYPFKTDISQSDQVENLISFSLSKLKSINILVNCAATHGQIGPTHEIDIDSWNQTIQTNLNGSFYLIRAVLPHMIDRQEGKIILLSGGGATSPLPYFSAYATSKAGLVRLAENISEEVKGNNIQINVIAPGMVKTTFLEDVISAESKAGAEYEKVKKALQNGHGLVSPELVANLAVFLASDLSGSLTGKIISAPHDPWEQWQGKDNELNSSPIFTIRRLDPYTIQQII